MSNEGLQDNTGNEQAHAPEAFTPEPFKPVEHITVSEVAAACKASYEKLDRYLPEGAIKERLSTLVGSLEVRMADLNPFAEAARHKEVAHDPVEGYVYQGFKAETRETLVLLRAMAEGVSEAQNPEHSAKLAILAMEAACTRNLVAREAAREYGLAEPSVERFLDNFAPMQFRRYVDGRDGRANNAYAAEFLEKGRHVNRVETVKRVQERAVARATTIGNLLKEFDVTLKELPPDNYRWERSVTVEVDNTPEPAAAQVAPEQDVSANPWRAWEAEVPMTSANVIDAAGPSPDRVRTLIGDRGRRPSIYLETRKARARKDFPNGGSETRNVKVVQSTVRQYVALSKLRGLSEGEAFFEREQLVPVAVFDVNARNVEKVNDFLEQLDAARASADGHYYYIPVVSGREKKWLKVTDIYRNNLVNSLKESRNSFEQAGFKDTRNRTRRTTSAQAAQPARSSTTVTSGFNEIACDENSAIDILRMANDLYEGFNSSMRSLSLTGNEKEQLKEQRDAAVAELQELSARYGKLSMYEGKAIQYLNDNKSNITEAAIRALVIEYIEEDSARLAAYRMCMKEFLELLRDVVGDEKIKPELEKLLSVFKSTVTERSRLIKKGTDLNTSQDTTGSDELRTTEQEAFRDEALGVCQNVFDELSAKMSAGVRNTFADSLKKYLLFGRVNTDPSYDLISGRGSFSSVQAGERSVKEIWSGGERTLALTDTGHATVIARETMGDSNQEVMFEFDPSTGEFRQRTEFNNIPFHANAVPEWVRDATYSVFGDRTVPDLKMHADIFVIGRNSEGAEASATYEIINKLEDPKGIVRYQKLTCTDSIARNGVEKNIGFVESEDLDAAPNMWFSNIDTKRGWLNELVERVTQEANAYVQEDAAS